jgi:hypothetical protein
MRVRTGAPIVGVLCVFMAAQFIVLREKKQGDGN